MKNKTNTINLPVNVSSVGHQNSLLLTSKTSLASYKPNIIMAPPASQKKTILVANRTLVHSAWNFCCYANTK